MNAPLLYLAELIAQLAIKTIVVMKVEMGSLAKEQLFEGQSQLGISIYNALYYFWTVVLGGVVSLTFFLWYWVKSRREFKKKLLLIWELKAINKDLEKKIDFKRMLLKENHHRVKNNLQMIISLLNIDIRLDKSKAIHYYIEKAETRVGVLALLYDSFSEIDTDNKVCLRVYVEKLVGYNRQMMGNDKVLVTVFMDEVFMDTQIAVSLGLIINELLCNSLKHAFTKDAEGKIVIRIKQINNGIYAFNYSDNGSKGKTETENKNPSGLQLIFGLVEQIAGYSIKTDWHQGLRYEFNFKNLS
jgi:two-component sensor histidine kinase